MRWAAASGALGVAAAGCMVEAHVGTRASIGRDLGVVTRGTCAVAPLVADVGPTCARVPGKVEVSPGADLDAARAAFDDDVCRTWNAGRSGAVSVGVDFGAAHDVAVVLLVSHERSTASHAIEASDDGVSYTALIVISGELVAGQAYAVVLPEPVVTTHLRVTTTGAKAPVSWREIIPLDCPTPPI